MTDKKKLNKILYVDDDHDILKIARLSLEKKGGFTVRTCDSGKKALEEVTAFQPDLIILDVVMPDMDGSRTMAELQKIPGVADIPVFFMTSRLHPDELDFYEKLGISGVLAKPFHPLEISNRVRGLWEKIPAPQG